MQSLEHLIPFPQEKLSSGVEEHWTAGIRQEVVSKEEVKVTLFFRRGEEEVKMATFFTPPLPFLLQALEELVARLSSEEEVEKLSSTFATHGVIEPSWGEEFWGANAFAREATPLERLLMLLIASSVKDLFSQPYPARRRLKAPLSLQALRKALEGRDGVLFLTSTATAMPLSLIPRVLVKGPFPTSPPLLPSHLESEDLLFLFGTSSTRKAYKQVLEFQEVANALLTGSQGEEPLLARWQKEAFLGARGRPAPLALTTAQGTELSLTSSMVLFLLPWHPRQLPPGVVFKDLWEGMTAQEAMALFSLFYNHRHQKWLASTVARFHLFQYLKDYPLMPLEESWELLKAWVPRKARRFHEEVRQATALLRLLQELLPQREAFPSLPEHLHFLTNVHPYLLHLLHEGLGAEDTLRLLLQWPEEEAFLTLGEVEALLSHPEVREGPVSWWLPLLRA